MVDVLRRGFPAAPTPAHGSQEWLMAATEPQYLKLTQPLSMLDFYLTMKSLMEPPTELELEVMKGVGQMWEEDPLLCCLKAGNCYCAPYLHLTPILLSHTTLICRPQHYAAQPFHQKDNEKKQKGLKHWSIAREDSEALWVPNCDR